MLESSRCRVRIAHAASQIHVGLRGAFYLQENDRDTSSPCASAYLTRVDVWSLYTHTRNELMPTQTILTRGSSLAFRLPAAIAKQMQLEEDAKVQLAIDGKRRVVQRIESVPDAKTFFAAVKASQSTHGLMRVVKASGKEIR